MGPGARGLRPLGRDDNLAGGILRVTVWFTADTHFGHAGALGRFKRPFRSVAEMDEAMIARWNDTVARGDEVWHLGDFAYRLAPDRMRDVLAGLNGAKHLIAGNNDGPA